MEKNLSRIDFSLQTKRLIADRAGHRCSYPTCNKITIGPGSSDTQISTSGTAAHIYSASSAGPRGQGGLSVDELKHPTNAIWLCATHARLVDNNRGEKYPPELLLSYKQLQEARIAREQEGLYTPLGWLFSFNIDVSPLFVNNSEFSLSKLTVLLGANCTGKTAICEWIAGLFEIQKLDRWRQPNTNIKYSLRYFCPDQINIGIDIKEKYNIGYSLNGSHIPFNPIKYKIVFPNPDPRQRPQLEQQIDDLNHLSSVFSIDESLIEKIAAEVNFFPHAKAKNLRFVSDDGYRTLYLDLQGTRSNLPFSLLSGREKETVLLEFATAIARFSGRHTPTLLILDSFIHIFFSGWFEYFSHHFLDPENQFQTLLTAPRSDFDLDDLRWNGWEVLRLSGEPPNVCIESGAQSAA